MASVATIPQELNWVQKRAACNVAEVFHQLCLEIRDDIIAINGILRKELYFKQDSLSDGSIVIAQPQRTPRIAVTIGIVEQQIMVQDQAAATRWSVRVGLNNEGRCVLKLEDGSELETWQFRKKALDALFFEK
jgi:hypothetical protein